MWTMGTFKFGRIFTQNIISYIIVCVPPKCVPYNLKIYPDDYILPFTLMYVLYFFYEIGKQNY